MAQPSYRSKIDTEQHDEQESCENQAQKLVDEWEDGTIDYSKFLDPPNHKNTLTLVSAYAFLRKNEAPPAVSLIELVAQEVLASNNKNGKTKLPKEIRHWWWNRGLPDPDEIDDDDEDDLFGETQQPEKQESTSEVPVQSKTTPKKSPGFITRVTNDSPLLKRSPHQHPRAAGNPFTAAEPGKVLADPTTTTTINQTGSQLPKRTTEYDKYATSQLRQLGSSSSSKKHATFRNLKQTPPPPPPKKRMRSPEASPLQLQRKKKHEEITTGYQGTANLGPARSSKFPASQKGGTVPESLVRFASFGASMSFEKGRQVGGDKNAATGVNSLVGNKKK